MSSVVGVKVGGVGGSSGGVGSNVAVLNKLAAPDDGVFGFSGGTLSSSLGNPLADSAHLEEYGDLNCFTAPSGGPVESAANMNLFDDLPGKDPIWFTNACGIFAFSISDLGFLCGRYIYPYCKTILTK